MINKKLLHAAVAVTLSCSAISASAALPVDATLKLDPQTGFCDFDLGTWPDSCTVRPVPDGNYFAMDNDGSGDFGNDERVGFEGGSDGGITLSGAQPNHGTDGPTDPLVPPEPGQIDAGWDFFGAHGWHITNAAPTIASDDGAGNVTLNMTGFLVHWNGGDIDMGTGADAIITCATDCSAGEAFTLDYEAVVPDGSFAGVAYQLHMTGVIELPLAVNEAPVANPDTATVDRKATGRDYTPSVIDILANDTDDNGISDIDRTSVEIDPDGTDTPTPGAVIAVDATTGNVTYTPADDFLGTDIFTYRVFDLGGPEGPGGVLPSNVTTVTITIQNAIPVAVDDDASIDTSSTTSILIAVTDNDTDSDGTINAMTVTIDPANDATNGSTAIEPTTGVVTYTPDTGFAGADSFKYTVEDNDGAISNLATVFIIVSSGAGILPESAFLLLNAGTGVAGEGSYFTMEVNPGKLTGVGLTGFDHIQLGATQLASVAMPGIDEPWLFFGNLGIHQTTSPITILADDKNGNVSLDFSGWDVSWNNIASIPLGEGADNGVATMTCQVDCAIGDVYSLIYHATIPPGDPSGFGGVSYILHLDGTITDTPPTVGGGDVDAPYLVTDVEPIVAVDDSTSDLPTPITVGPGTTATNAGKTLGVNLTPEDVGKDPLLNDNDGEQCIGGCVDFIATGVTTDFIDVTFKLNKPLPSGGVYRKLINGKWTGFVTSGTDQIGSADADAEGNCQGPEGKYNTGLREGAACIFLRIYDGGPNDQDGVKNGTIVDPSGTLLAGSPNVPPSSTSSGCSISNTKVDLSQRADWLIVAGFIVWLGLIGYRRNKAVN